MFISLKGGKKMKIWKKRMATVLAVAGLGFGSIAAPVNAQTSFDQTFFEELAAANKSYEGLAFSGAVKLGMVQDDQAADLGSLDFTGVFNQNPLQFSFIGNLSSMLLGLSGSEVSAYYKDQVIYLGLPDLSGENPETAWQAYDFAELEGSFLSSLTAYSNLEVDPAASASLNQKYTTVTETETGYEVALNQDINADELWADINSLIDMEALKAQVIAQVEAESGQTLTEEEKAQIEQSFNKDTLANFLSTNPKVVSTYNKETKVLEKMVLDMTISPAAYMPAEETTTAEGSSTATTDFLPQNITIKLELNFTNHNQPQEVVVPDAAQAVEVQSIDQAEETTLAE